MTLAADQVVVLLPPLFVYVVCEIDPYNLLLVLHPSRRRRESWLLYSDCMLAAMWLLVFSVSSSRCRGMVRKRELVALF